MKNVAKVDFALPSLPEGFGTESGEQFTPDAINGSQLHLLKWMVGEYGFASMNDAIADCIVQGFKYSKRLYDAEAVRLKLKIAAAAQETFDAWARRNSEAAKDPRKRIVAMRESGLPVDQILWDALFPPAPAPAPAAETAPAPETASAQEAPTAPPPTAKPNGKEESAS